MTAAPKFMPIPIGPAQALWAGVLHAATAHPGVQSSTTFDPATAARSFVVVAPVNRFGLRETNRGEFVTAAGAGATWGTAAPGPTMPTPNDLGVLYGGRNRLLTVREVAEQLDVCAATVYRLCENGELPHVRIIDSIRIRPADLGAFVAAPREPDPETCGG
jgi:excisionase family DNA binding protein